MALPFPLEFSKHFKDMGKGYQTHINQVIKAYVKHRVSSA
jgi:uncharacterized protein (DUF4415 family)|tara:strand:+ start:1034 stop:1153 length:120 start_codon:yes stop_codon:yes gene_type:complete